MPINGRTTKVRTFISYDHEFQCLLKTTVSVLDWISIYWFSRAGPAASVRLYYESTKAGGFFEGPAWVSIPTGVSWFPKELCPVPKT